MHVCAMLGITQTCTSYNNPKDIADTERLLRTLKNDALGSASGQALLTWSRHSPSGFSGTTPSIGTPHWGVGYQVGSNSNISATVLRSWLCDKWGDHR
nr:hypothetical protein [Nitrosomonas nitrosa]